MCHDSILRQLYSFISHLKNVPIEVSDMQDYLNLCAFFESRHILFFKIKYLRKGRLLKQGQLSIYVKEGAPCLSPTFDRLHILLKPNLRVL